MAQHVSEPSLLVALEDVPKSTPYSFTVTSVVPSYQPFQSQALGSFTPLISRRRQTVASLGSVTESVSVTATRAPDFQLTAPLTQGFDTFGTHSAESSSVVGSFPFGQSMSQPLLTSGPSRILHFSLPTDGTPDEQYQNMMEMAQTL